MKPFIVGLYALFLFAMACGITVAYRNSEGLVENDYFEKGNAWFRTKDVEKRLGFEVAAPERLQAGSNTVRFTLTEHGKPLRNADARLFFGSVSTKEHDVSTRLIETSPGVYETTAHFPAKGKWLVRLDLGDKQIKTSRSWFYDVE